MADQDANKPEPAPDTPPAVPQAPPAGTVPADQPADQPAVTVAQGPAAAANSAPAPNPAPNSSPSLVSRVLFPDHDPDMAQSNFYIDRRAAPLALGVMVAIGVCAWFVTWVTSWNMPGSLPAVVMDATTFSKGQMELVKEVNRQLAGWLSLSRNYEVLAMVMGATAAALTVLVGFIKEHTKSKMFLMAMSAALSVFIGTVNPAEKATRFLNSWRVLYAEVNVTNAKTSLTEPDFVKLANALSTAESALTQKADDAPPASSSAPKQ